jgi:ADP-ribosyl-[dinitrogen reductase] hydrolase
MLLEGAIGDSYGVCFEFNEPRYIAEFNNLEGYVPHLNHPGLKPGMYSDDTQMSIAIAELIVSKKPWTRENIAEKFVECFHRDPRRGYAGRFYLFLLDHKDATSFLRDIMPVSDKSGAAMRAAPLGIFSDFKEVKEKCEIQACITHWTDNGIRSALAAATTSYFFHQTDDPKEKLPAFLKDKVCNSWDWSHRWKGKVGVSGMECVQAAITAILETNSLSSLLKRCIDFTGDVDTIATIALSCASGSDQFAHDLPQSLYDGLENGKYGKDYISDLDKKLSYIMI